MNGHAVGQIRIGEPGTNSRGIAGFDPVIASEMQGGGLGCQPGEGIEQVMNALSLNPIPDTEECRAPSLAEIPRWRGSLGGDIASGRNHQELTARYPVCDEFLGQRLAGDQQTPHPAVGQPV